MSKNKLSIILFLSFFLTPILKAQVEIHVLGISQDAGRPQVGCNKTCCLDSLGIPLPYEMPSCLGITLPDSSSILVEATPSLSKQWNTLSKLNHDLAPEKIFITHAHIGHYSGLMYLGREAMNCNNIDIYGGQRFTNFIKNNGPWDQLVNLKNIRLKKVNEKQKIEIGDLIIQALKVPHRDEYSETYGYIFNGKNKSLLFIPDIDKWAKWHHDIDSIIQTVDYALLDGTFYDQSELPNRDMSQIPHPFVSESIDQWKLWSTDKKNKIYFIHLNHSNPLFNKNSKEYSQVKQQGFNIAETGMKFIL